MSRVVFIGDELTAAGYRLAGADVSLPCPAEVPAAFEEAVAGADLVMITVSCANRVPEDRLEASLVKGSPLVLIVPDATESLPAPDLAQDLRSVLGVEA